MVQLSEVGLDLNALLFTDLWYQSIQILLVNVELSALESSSSTLFSNQLFRPKN